MVYSEKWYIILLLFTKLIDSQNFTHFTTICTMQDYFEPYFGSHKTRNSLMLKNMQKNFSGSHPTSQSRPLRPLNPLLTC